jgi:hypothetical protein
MIASVAADEVGLTGHDMAQKPGFLTPARPSPRKNPPTLDKSYSL